MEYVEQGSGEPVVLVHGAVSDLRVWEPVRNALAKDHRVITYTQRYFGTGPWPDEGKDFSMATHADDLAAFISSLDTGPGPTHEISHSRRRSSEGQDTYRNS